MAPGSPRRVGILYNFFVTAPRDRLAEQRTGLGETLGTWKHQIEVVFEQALQDARDDGLPKSVVPISGGGEPATQ